MYDFDNDVKLLQDYTTDKDAAKAAIDLLASGGSTAMADALLKRVWTPSRSLAARA